jgi:N-acylneuraminate cytidylyltransferase
MLGGIPLVAHSIIHAINAQIDARNIFVSSDGTEILNVAREYGVQACLRPREISGDDSSTEEALLHVLAFAESRLGSVLSILLLQPTSPIRLKSTIPTLFDECKISNCDSVLSVTEFYNFFWQTDPSGWMSSYDPVQRPMRQSLSSSDYRYFDNGNMYWMRKEILKNTGCRLGGKIGTFIISPLEGLQIDVPQDLELMKVIFEGGLAPLTGVAKC